MITSEDVKKLIGAEDTKQAVIAVRFSQNDPMFQRLEEIAGQNQLSMNMTVKMLLGYAFNEVDASGKTFVSKIVFESK